MHGPTLRQASRRHAPATAALFAAVGLLATGCTDAQGSRHHGSGESADLHLVPVAAAGADPFTTSSATNESAPAQAPVPNPTGQGIRTVNAATPGLYAGTQRLGSCDIEQQLRLLTEDDDKARVFAETSGVEAAELPEFLRGLTPVVLRADTRVTNHGFRDGKATGHQAVLQAGTAVLVDAHGMPRVRCACGNPLQAPRAPKGAPVHKGDPWAGYQPNQVIVVEPTMQTVDNLVLVNLLNNTWLERRTGDDGAQDKVPQHLTPYDPAEGIPDRPPTTQTPQDPQARTDAADGQPVPADPGVPQQPPANPQTRPRQPEIPDAPPSPPRPVPTDPTDPGTGLPTDPGLTPTAPEDLTQPLDGLTQDPFAEPVDPNLPLDPTDPNTSPDAEVLPEPDVELESA
ncbi:DUF6777 domain-containing protein [Streptomyces antimicrobicus]|uniref:DUF6777 domain-containing protein n=1 Tax=Streptomyces antimicrobicus TaxID=2883108 RepID=A0ABS8B7V1_9ACTN|nr:DUF6777 domain-containing protein [Streptomyces antimicrobicus]MCB5180711.1 hypothetical protein [Streptomyces antimicrobicus]